MFTQKNVEQREQHIRKRWGAKVSFKGNKAKEVKQVTEIYNNKKGNRGLYVPVEGVWANRFVEDNELELIYILVAVEDVNTPEAYALMCALGDRAPKVHLVSAKTMKSLSESGNPAGLISVCRFPRRPLTQLLHKKNNLIVIMDGLEIPGNVGTITRSADGTDVDALIICNKKTRLTHPKFIRSSQGSCFKVPIAEATFDELADFLQKHHFKIVLSDTRGSKPYYENDYAGNVAIVMGSERYGISKGFYELAHEAVHIPMFGSCDSLNVGIAATVILYEAALKRKGFLGRN